MNQPRSEIRWKGTISRIKRNKFRRKAVGLMKRKSIYRSDEGTYAITTL